MAFDEKLFWHQTAQVNRLMNRTAHRLRELAGRNFQKHTTGYTDALLAYLRTKTKRTDGEIDTIKLGVLRYGIIREYGAGRGWPGGRQETINSETPRTPAPWLEESFAAIVPGLANSLSKIKGDDMVQEVDELFKSTFQNNYRIS